MNDYKIQFENSLSQNDKNWWQEFFKENIINWEVSIEEEYKGIDAYLNDKKIQFKIRETYYPDILIEFGHTNGEKGWINKIQECEYIIFGWKPHNEIYIFKWDVLQEFWKKNQVILFKKYGYKNVKYAVNLNKITLNYSIPFDSLPMHNTKTK